VTEAAGPPAAPAARPPLTRTARFAWIAVVMIVVLVIALLVVALTHTTVIERSGEPAPVAASTLADLASLPTAAFDAVGVSAPTSGVHLPRVVRAGTPLLTSDGKPLVFYTGAEYCPFCAAERWALVVALSRFGHFTTLYETSSSATNAYPSTPTFSFAGAAYTSPYVSFTGVEQYSTVTASGGGFARIATLTPDQQALVDRFDHPVAAAEPFPFVDVANRLVTTAAGFSPAVLHGLSQGAVLADLGTPSTPAAQGIIAAANALSAGVCAATGQQPTAVCTSSGVVAADRALHLAVPG
jgi:uncharacterized membrane protein